MSEKKFPAPLLNTVFRGHIMCPGGSLLKKRGANDILLKLCISEKKAQPPLLQTSLL